MTNDELYEIICTNIRNILKQDKIKLNSLSEAIGMSSGQFYNKISNCGAKFNLLQIKQICEELLVDFEELTTADFYTEQTK